jgi:hypothetical protein
MSERNDQNNYVDRIDTCDLRHRPGNHPAFRMDIIGYLLHGVPAMFILWPLAVIIVIGLLI